MKRSYIITAGIVVILLVVGIWVYLLLSGSPTGADRFSNLGFNFAPQDVTVIDTTDSNQPTYTIDINQDRLQQLTTRPVAGFVGTSIASSSVVRYVEQGTGHIYEINMITGVEEMISRTTVPKVYSAHFSPDGQTVAITTLNGYIKDTLFSAIDPNTDTLDGISLPPGADNMTVTEEGNARYTLIQEGTLFGYEHTLDNDLTELFRTPFQHIIVNWSPTQTRFYNRPAKDLIGYLYEVQSGSFVGTPLNGFGLNVDDLGNYQGFTKVVDGQVVTGFYSTTTDESWDSPVLIVPEKCTTIGADKQIVCAAGIDQSLNIDAWYKGVVNSDDHLWAIDPESSQSTLLENLEKTAGRTIDVYNLKSATTGDYLLFTNKIDGTLWRYNI